MRLKKYYVDIQSFDKHLVEILAQENDTVLVLYPNYPVEYKADIVEWSTFLEQDNLSIANDCNVYKDIVIPDDLYKIREQYDVIIMSRIIEHIPLEKYLFTFYQLSKLCKDGARLAITYPDMLEVVDIIKKINIKTDYLKYHLYNIELFNEGSYHDLHKTFTTKDMIEYIVTLENIFQLQSTSDLFAIGNDRMVYRCSCFIRKTII